MSLQSPPQLGDWFLATLLPKSDREVMAGDLAEEYSIRIREASHASAVRWYWGQVFRSTSFTLWVAVIRGRWVATAGVALAAYVAASVLEYLTTVAISRLLAPSAAMNNVLSVVVGLTTMLLGGYVAAMIRRSAARALAAIVLIAVVLLMLAIPDSAPLWYQLAFLFLGPAASLTGGALFLRGQGAQRD